MDGRIRVRLVDDGAHGGKEGEILQCEAGEYAVGLDDGNFYFDDGSHLVRVSPVGQSDDLSRLFLPSRRKIRDQLRQWRKRRGLTQAELAQCADVSYYTVRNMESDSEALRQLENIAKALNVTIELRERKPQ